MLGLGIGNVVLFQFVEKFVLPKYLILINNFFIYIDLYSYKKEAISSGICYIIHQESTINRPFKLIFIIFNINYFYLLII